jgi:glycosyltransferase involved in cell wall biosynthesis
MLRDEDVADSVTTLPYEKRRPIRFGLYVNDVQERRDLNDLWRVNHEAAALIDGGGYDAVLVDACRFTFAPPILTYLRTPSAYYCHHRPWAREARLPRFLTGYERTREAWHGPLAAPLRRRLWQGDFDSVRAADLVLTNSNWNAERVLEVYGVEAQVCPPGVDLPPIPPVPGARRHLLAVASIEWHKGLDFLIEVVGQLPPEGRPPLVIAAVAGNPGLAVVLERQARRLGIDLTIRRSCGADELDSLYRSAIVFLWGSLLEALGLAPLEAMAHSVPVVAVAEGGALETVVDEETGFLVPRDASRFAAKVEALLASPSLRERMGRAGRREVERSWAWARRTVPLEAELEALAVERAAGERLERR